MFLLCFSAKAQPVEILVAKDSVVTSEIDPLRPAKAAFFSAIVPGLGQAYNKKYWKIPIVYGAMGTSMYFYIENNRLYHQYRDAYKDRLAGKQDEFTFLDNSRLIAAQRLYQRNRDMSLLVTGLFYILNIVDANVDAHLMQFNVDENLSLVPSVNQNQLTAAPIVGFTLNYTF
ncbi:MAG: hypothetical protein IR153_08875 [Flavobacterium sp.]|nr:hypothetical protein [Flavobacterium sp.]